MSAVMLRPVIVSSFLFTHTGYEAARWAQSGGHDIGAVEQRRLREREELSLALGLSDDLEEEKNVKGGFRSTEEVKVSAPATAGDSGMIASTTPRWMLHALEHAVNAYLGIGGDCV
eukprot:scaffold103403_cov21-Tisochrysis_lutea.AAC.1